MQELLAEGDFRIGYYYYVKEDKKAAESRLRAIVNRYPLYSKSDRALWMLGNIWESTEKKEIAAPYYARIVRNYPLSALVPDAKSRLKALGAPVPQADPQAVAWMTAEQNAPRQRELFIKKPLALIHTGPAQELRAAATNGKPTMTPEAESEAGIDVLAGGSQPRIGGGGLGTGIVATVRPGGGSVTTDGAESVAPTTAGSEATPTTQPDPNAPAATETSDGGTTAVGTADSAPKTDATPPAAAQASDALKTDGSTEHDGTQNGTKGSGKKESSSKKKKGLRRIVPW